MARPLGRKRLIGQIHAAKTRLGLDDENYRALLHGCTGKSSCASMTVAELQNVLAKMGRQGGWQDWSPRYPSGSQEAKLVALWITAFKAGRIKNGSHGALVEYVWRGLERPATMLPGVDLLRAAPAELKSNKIEGLAALLERGGISRDG